LPSSIPAMVSSSHLAEREADPAVIIVCED
jgi:hypothetical protein